MGCLSSFDRWSGDLLQLHPHFFNPFFRNLGGALDVRGEEGDAEFFEGPAVRPEGGVVRGCGPALEPWQPVTAEALLFFQVLDDG